MRTKEALLRAKSTRKEADKCRLDYWAIIRIVARRLHRSTKSKGCSRANRPLYEEFKEKFFHQRQHKKTANERAWFFYHVRQVYMRYKMRYLQADYRCGGDGELDMGVSTDEDEEEEPYMVVKGDERDKEGTERKDFWKSSSAKSSGGGERPLTSLKPTKTPALKPVETVPVALTKVITAKQTEDRIRKRRVMEDDHHEDLDGGGEKWLVLCGVERHTLH